MTQTTDCPVDLRWCRWLALALGLVLSFAATGAHASGLKLSDICRLKGQETNTLHGWGLVVGLRGTGDSDAPTVARALAQSMQRLGAPMTTDGSGSLNLADISATKNVAAVMVSCTVPATGSQPGDKLDVFVNAISAKSLEGGTLMLTSLVGPRPGNSKVYAQAQGRLTVSLDGSATSATVHGGAKMEAPVEASYHQDGLLTLVLERDFASFDTAQRIEDEINNLSAQTFGSTLGGSASRARARAIDQVHIEVQIPQLYRENPIKFISFLLNITVRLPNRSMRVVINEREGVVVIGKDVEIAPVLITHRNLRIEAGRSPGFIRVGNEDDQVANAKLKSLADALNALDVPTEDFIAIIKTLKRKGDLFGEVVFQ